MVDGATHMDGAPHADTRTTPLFPTGRGKSDTHATTLSGGRPNPSAQAGQPYATIDTVGIIKMMKDPPQVPKEDAAWFIPSVYAESDARTHAVQREHGLFHLLAVDVDKGNPPLDAVEAALDAVARGAYRLIYSTRSATPDDRRWRVLLPLAKPLAGADYEDTQNALFDLLAERGIETDRSLARPAQLVFLPNRGEHYEFALGQRLAAEADDRSPDHPAARGDPPEAGRGRSGGEGATGRRSSASAPHAGPTPASRRSSVSTGSTRSRRCSIGTATSSGGNSHDWRSRYQSSGSHATRDYGEYWTSLSDSDAGGGARLGIGQRVPLRRRLRPVRPLRARRQLRRGDGGRARTRRRTAGHRWGVRVAGLGAGA